MLVRVVRRTIEQRALIDRGSCVLAACSGGPDSAAMLAALAELSGDLGFSLRAASVDHQLRADSARDLSVARDQARALGVPFEPLRVQLTPGASLQAQARAARYEALCAAAARVGAARIAVGHTRDDQAETVLMRLLRGAGLAGLAAIEPLRADGVIRPLIDCARVDAHAFAAARFSQIATDPTNLDPRYERVRVRTQLLPVLLTEDPKLVEHLAQLADDAAQAEGVLRSEAERALERCRQDPETISVSSLNAEPEAIRRRVLALWVKERTGAAPGRAHLSSLARLLSHGGEVWLPGRYAARLEANTLALVRLAAGRVS